MQYIPFAFPGIPGVACAFQTRVGGVSQGAYAGGNISLDVGDAPEHVMENRARLFRALGLESCIELQQVHGETIHFASETDTPGTGSGSGPACPEGDGLATSRPGVALMIKSADCQGILLAHTSGRYIAALHVGWRGNRLGFPTSAVKRFCAQYQLDPREVLAVRGPSLGPANAEFASFESDWGEAFRPWYSPERQTMDLWSLTRAQLAEAGLVPEHMFGLDLCTASMPEWFFSYRRQNVCGRQASLIWIRTALA